MKPRSRGGANRHGVFRAAVHRVAIQRVGAFSVVGGLSVKAPPAPGTPVTVVRLVRR